MKPSHRLGELMDKYTERYISDKEKWFNSTIEEIQQGGRALTPELEAELKDAQRVVHGNPSEAGPEFENWLRSVASEIETDPQTISSSQLRKKLGHHVFKK
jgi:hypothetical protein